MCSSDLLMIGGGCLLAAAGMFVLASLQHGTGFWVTAIGYLLVGLGFGSAVPLVSSQAMGDVPIALAGVGSGILNSARQIGASVGLAVLGAIGVGVATHAWDHKVGSLPASVQAQAHSVRQDVAGGRPIHLGTVAQSYAHDSFLTGYHWAMAAAGVALVGASGAAFAGLRSRGAVAERRAVSSAPADQ